MRARSERAGGWKEHGTDLTKKPFEEGFLRQISSIFSQIWPVFLSYFRRNVNDFTVF
jgi:hypothetical protein